MCLWWLNEAIEFSLIFLWNLFIVSFFSFSAIFFFIILIKMFYEIFHSAIWFLYKVYFDIYCLIIDLIESCLFLINLCSKSIIRIESIRHFSSLSLVARSTSLVKTFVSPCFCQYTLWSTRYVSTGWARSVLSCPSEDRLISG